MRLVLSALAAWAYNHPEDSSAGKVLDAADSATRVRSIAEPLAEDDRNSTVKRCATCREVGHPACAVIWLHGLGDWLPGSSATGGHWQVLFEERAKLGESELPRGCQWRFPRAPVQRVSAKGGNRMRSWFDIESLPIEGNTTFVPETWAVSVSAVHGMLDALGARVPPERILLGGFSQGAALSLRAGLTYPKRLAGVLALGGWLPGEFAPTAAAAESPVLQLHGAADETVYVAAARAAHARLEAAGVHATLRIFPGLGHQSVKPMLSAVTEFLRAKLDANLPTPEAPYFRLVQYGLVGVFFATLCAVLVVRSGSLKQQGSKGATD